MNSPMWNTVTPPVAEHRGNFGTACEPVGSRQHGGCSPSESDAQAAAALGAAVSQHRATCTRAHPQPEAMGLGPTTVVRLVCALHNVRLASFLDASAGCSVRSVRIRICSCVR